MRILRLVEGINMAVVLLMTAAYFYQYIYIAVGLFRRAAKPLKAPAQQHRFAALICARNEERVIAQLIDSLKQQTYRQDLLDVYVLADNCTDNTAQAARQAGATVYERRNLKQIGKGYALDELLTEIKRDKGASPYDGYFVFDADNLVDKNFVFEMNKTFSAGYQVITCYRNSKNFAANWITAAYSIWFLREARFLNHPRMLMKNSCAVSGTGFFVSQQVIDENGGWPFHMLTEDIQFSADCIVKGRKIGYCDGAIVYDEQPTSFAQSWTQRLRWSKGFFQVNSGYLGALAKGTFVSKNAKMSCYDMMMTIIPCVFLTVVAVVFNLVMLVVCLTQPEFIIRLVTQEAVRYLIFALVNYYLGLFLYGAVTVACEWKRIRATGWQKVKYLWAFPLFMATYIPVTFAALFQRVSWTHIEHYSAADVAPDASGRI